MKNKKLLYIIIGIVVAIVVALVITLPIVLTRDDGAGAGGPPASDEPTDDPPDIPPDIPPAACEHTHTEWIVTDEATCTRTGKRKNVCSDCGSVLSIETLPATDHDYPEEWSVAALPTTTAAGERIKVCANDGSHVIADVVPKLEEGDTYVVASHTEATCSALGTTVYSSEEYGRFTVYAQRTAHDHSTAQTDGKCAVCGEKISSLNLGFQLNADGDGYIVTKTNRYTDTDLVIPAEYNGLPVTEIASEAFAEWKWITSITIPESIKVIGAGAFSQMSGVTKVYFNATECDDLNGRNWVFYPAVDGSSKPIELIVGSNVRRIPARLFYPLATEPNTVSALSKITFEEGSVLESIGDYAFYRTAIESIELPDSVITVGDHAFYGTKLSSVVLGKNTVVLCDGAFGACESLESVTFDRKLETIGDDCFNYCVKLTTVDLDATKAISLGVGAFKYCYELQEAVLPITLESIGNAAFRDCVKLEKAILADGTAHIGDEAFYGCVGLSRVAIPINVTSIGKSAFENCTSLIRVDYNAVAADDLAAGNRVFAGAGGEDGVKVVIAATVSSLPARLFFSSARADENMAVSELIIYSGVTDIGDYAFYGCTVDSATFTGSDEQWGAVTVGDHNEAISDIAVTDEEVSA